MNHIASPDSSDPGIERLIQSKNLNAPRVTPSDLEAVIASEHYFTAAEGVVGAHWSWASDDDLVIRRDNLPESMHLLTFCVLVLKNGFTVTGESACVSPENFDAEIGRKVARENAKQKLWPLLGYALKQNLYETGRTTV